jgi:hypothetical protein
MLIIRASVNFNGIEDLLIHNTGIIDEKGNTLYEIMNPENSSEKLIPDVILHKKENLYYLGL